MKMSIGRLRKLIRESIISDHIKLLQRYEKKEYDLQMQFGDALEQLIHHQAMYGSLRYTSSDADKLVIIFEKGYVVIDKGSGVGDDVLHAETEDGESMVWDDENGVWWVMSEDPQEFDRVANRTRIQSTNASKACPDCDGQGKWQGLFGWNTCQTCGGTGKVTS